MDDLTPMAPQQSRHLRELEAAWQAYGPALREWSSLDGGMTWKTVGGAEYLARYRQIDGRKRFTSLGRRCPELEAVYDDFIARRAAAKDTVVSMRDTIATAGRVAKVYGLARLPAGAAEVIRAFWVNGFDVRMCLFGGTALFGYEGATGMLAPADLARDDRLIFVTAESPLTLPVDDLRSVYEATVRVRAEASLDADRFGLTAAGTLGVEIWRQAVLVEHLEDEDLAEVLAEHLALPAIESVAFARDGQPVALRTLDLRAYALAATVLGSDEGVWAQRAEFAGALVRRAGLDNPRFERASEIIRTEHTENDERLRGP